MLLEMLKESKSFQEKPITEQEIIARLASEFESDRQYLYSDPIELVEETGLGNKQMWTNFLNLEPVKNYIRSEMNHQTQIAQRRAFQALAKSAEQGNVQAAKEINELSGIMSQGDSNKVVVLHQIQRPKIQKGEKNQNES